MDMEWCFSDERKKQMESWWGKEMPTWDFIKPFRWQSKLLELNSAQYWWIPEILWSLIFPTDEIFVWTVIYTSLFFFLINNLLRKIKWELFGKLICFYSTFGDSFSKLHRKEVCFWYIQGVNLSYILIALMCKYHTSSIPEVKIIYKTMALIRLLGCPRWVDRKERCWGPFHLKRTY